MFAIRSFLNLFFECNVSSKNLLSLFLQKIRRLVLLFLQTDYF